MSTPFADAAREELALGHTVVAYNGAVIERYPNYRNDCQGFLDEMVAQHAGAEDASIELVAATESSLLGAAVAAAGLSGEQEKLAEAVITST